MAHNGLDRMPNRRPTHRLSPAYKDKTHHRTRWAAPDSGWPRFCQGCGRKVETGERQDRCDVCVEEGR